MEAVINFFLGLSPVHIYIFLLFMLLMSGMGVPLPEDIILIAGAYSAYKGLSNPFILVIVGIIGVLIGDSFIYFLGHQFGFKIINFPFFKRIFSEARVTKASNIFKKRGVKFLFVARFLAGLRAPIFFSSATLGVKFKDFIFYDGMAALISVPAIIYVTFYNGEYVELIFSVVRRLEYVILGLFLIFLFFIFLRKFKKKELKC